MCTALLLNVAAWKSSRFCDFYVEKIFPAWSSISSRVTSLFPFSLGEWMIVAGLCFAALFVLSAALRLTVKKSWSVRLFAGMRSVLCWGGLALFWVMTCNCFLLYHSAAFEDRYMEAVRVNGYSKKELAALRDYIVVNANELAGRLPRDEEGWLIYEADMNEMAAEAMQSMGEEYGTTEGILSGAEGNLFFRSFESDVYEGVLFPVFYGSEL